MRFLFGAVIAVAFLDSAVGFAIDSFEETEEWPRSAGAPATPHPPVTPDLCKKDLLIVLDTSYSIGRNHFDKNVRPFLLKLVQDSKLNVAQDGTHLALITFSNFANTKDRFNFGKYKTPQEYVNYFNSYDFTWNRISGDRTYTGKALKLGNDKFFTNDSPLNARTNIADVVLLITDGNPNGVRKELDIALHESSELKKKNVLIVAVAVGPIRTNPVFQKNLVSMATSKSTVFDAEFDGLDKIIGNIIDASCTPFKPGDCSCPTISSKNLYLKPSQTSVDVSWVQPTLQCSNNRKPSFVKTAVSPNIQSPHSFGVGDHNIVYTYTFKGGFDLKCYVKIFVKSCTCPTNPQPVIGYVSQAQASTKMQWKAPTPTCRAILMDIQPNTPSGSSFTLGIHSVSYVYATIAGFDLTCDVKIDVRKCVCQSNTKLSYVKPDSPNAQVSVTWVQPKPNCPGQFISVERSTGPVYMKPGANFSVGTHTMWYRYDMSSGIKVQCSQTIEVRVVPCQGVDYDPRTHMCCCGKVRLAGTGQKCCGRRSYDSTLLKCCPVNYNLVDLNASCPGGGVSV